MIWVVSVSHYFQPLNEPAALPALDDELKNVCREPLRRIDRFIQLALLGSARCAAGRSLQPDCGIYLGSGLGPMSNNIATQEQLIRAALIPKPFNFINTLGSGAGFYVARNLGLHGQNLFISRRGASFTALLTVAAADLSLGVVRQALVGVVEEATLPLTEHRARQHLPEDMPLAEGSHWLLLQTGADGRGSLEVRRYPEYAELETFLKSAWRTGDRVCCAGDMASRAAQMLMQRFPDAAPAESHVAFHDSLDAARVTGFAVSQPHASLFLVNGNFECGWELFHFRA
ncbi:MAG: hypothetical protein WCC11_04045 [Gammaproteobacteria bacterium]